MDSGAQPTWEESTPLSQNPGASPNSNPTWDESEPIDQGYWKTAGQNALKEGASIFKNIPQVPGALLKQAGDYVRQGMPGSPLGIGATATGQNIGQPGFENTPFGKDMMPQAEGMAQSYGSPIESFKQRPIGTTADWLTAASLASQGAAPALEDTAQTAGTRAMGISRRTAKILGTERTKDIAQTMLDKGVIKSPITSPIESSAEGIASRAGDLADQAGTAIGKTLDELDKNGVSAFNTNDVAKQITDQLKPKYTGGNYDLQGNTLNEILDTIKAHGDGPISFNSAQDLKNTLKNGAKFSSATDAMKAGMYRQAYHIVRSELDRFVDIGTKGLQDSGSDVIGDYLKNKDLYGKALTAQDASEGLAAGELTGPQLGMGSRLVALHGALGGNPERAAETILPYEWLRSRGNALEATTANFLGKGARGIGQVTNPVISPAIGASILGKMKQQPSQAPSQDNNQLNPVIGAPQAMASEFPPQQPQHDLYEQGIIAYSQGDKATALHLLRLAQRHGIQAEKAKVAIDKILVE